MPYIDGFVIAVPKGNKQKFIEHANKGDSVFIEYGATRVLECWGDDVPEGKHTDFRRAVAAKDDEDIVFSWIEWPDKATRDAGMKKVIHSFLALAHHPGGVDGSSPSLAVATSSRLSPSMRVRSTCSSTTSTRLSLGRRAARSLARSSRVSTC